MTLCSWTSGSGAGVGMDDSLHIRLTASEPGSALYFGNMYGYFALCDWCPGLACC
jgi:hypothetical protein